MVGRKMGQRRENESQHSMARCVDCGESISCGVLLRVLLRRLAHSVLGWHQRCVLESTCL